MTERDISDTDEDIDARKEVQVAAAVEMKEVQVARLLMFIS
ncbi:MAG: hypothetical protein WA667_26785 [Candidatus Nitrosopolaris sp.]